MSCVLKASFHVIELLYVGFGLVIGFIEHLQNITTNNYDSRTELLLKITVTTAHIKSSQFAMSSPVIAWWRIPTTSSASLLTLLLAGNCLTTNSLLELSTLNWLSLTVLLITSWHAPHRKRCSLSCFQLLPCEHACLWSCYLVMAVVYLRISQSLPSGRSPCHNTSLL
jgi:hypothetical protein